MNWVIYALKDPRTDEVRYIGLTRQRLRKRLQSHVAESLRTQETRKHKWISAVVRAGLLPVIESLESGSGKGSIEAECRWIARYREAGTRLLNISDGGEWNFIPDKDRQRRSEVMKSRWAALTPEERSAEVKKIFASVSSDKRSAMSRDAAARRTPEQREAFRAAVKAGWSKRTPEERSAAALEANAKQTAEQRRARALKRWSRTTPGERLAHGQKSLAGKTPEQRKAITARQAALTPAQRSQRNRRGMAKFWAKMKPEERSAVVRKLSEGTSRRMTELWGKMTAKERSSLVRQWRGI